MICSLPAEPPPLKDHDATSPSQLNLTTMNVRVVARLGDFRRGFPRAADHPYEPLDFNQTLEYPDLKLTQNHPTLGRQYDKIEDDDSCRSIATRNDLSLLELYVASQPRNQP